MSMEHLTHVKHYSQYTVNIHFNNKTIHISNLFLYFEENVKLINGLLLNILFWIFLEPYCDVSTDRKDILTLLTFLWHLRTLNMKGSFECFTCALPRGWGGVGWGG